MNTTSAMKILMENYERSEENVKGILEYLKIKRRINVVNMVGGPKKGFGGSLIKGRAIWQKWRIAKKGEKWQKKETGFQHEKRAKKGWYK